MTMTNVEIGKARAAAARASRSAADNARGDALTASAADLFARMWVGPANSHGRQALYIATQEEHDARTA